MPTHWVGIDEAGYGPNLGPLVMTAVVAASADDRRPDVWGDLKPAVCRAGGDPSRLWVDDSKALYRHGQGRDRLEAACLAVAAAASPDGRPPATLSALLQTLGASSLAAAELSPWLGPEPVDIPVPSTPQARERLDRAVALGSFGAAPWRVVAVRSVVVGPAAFNAGLARPGANKATVHFDAFARLLREVWSFAPGGTETVVRGDKHGGRHFYHAPLADAFPETWVERGPEGPELSRYALRDAARNRRLELSLTPRADADDGLVSLASVVSKTVRELWMDAFNSHWAALLPGLKPTAGYPVDAARFRRAIEPHCLARGLDPAVWWRRK